MTFNYTHGNDDVDSSAVYEVYYDAVTSRLAVVLPSGTGYVYSNVPVGVYHTLVSSFSPGGYYARTIKRDYGPSESLGYVGYNNIDFFVKTSEAPSMAAVGTPKGLTLASGVVVADNTNARFDLSYTHPTNDVPNGVKYTHAVVFTLEGGNNRKTYNVEAGSIHEAIDALSEATDALGLNVDVKEVTVYFE